MTYADIAPIYSQCVAIPDNAPITSGGAPTTFSVLPPLPTGLVLDPLTGVISGTPTDLTATSTHTITASNAVGAASAEIVISVQSADPAGIDYGASTLHVAVGIDPNIVPTLDVGASNQWSVVAGSLPDGLVLDPQTGEITGAATFVGAASPSPITVRATNCAGATTTIDLTIVVDAPVQRAAYVLNDAEPVLSTYCVDASSGLMRSRGYIDLPDTAPGTLVVSPNGRWLFISDGDSTAIQTFACDLVDGTPTDTGLYVELGELPASRLVVHPSNRWLYAINNIGVAKAFAIDPATGALTPTGVDVAVGDEPSSLVLDAGGRVAYVASSMDATITCMHVDSQTGALSAFATVATGTAPNDLALSRDGAWLFCANQASGSISVYARQLQSGGLVAVAGSPFATSTGHRPTSLAVDASSRFLYVAESDVAALEAFSIASGNGSLTPLASSPFALSDPVTALTLSPDGLRLHAFVYRDGWRAFDIAGNGVLHEATAAVFVGRFSPRALAFQPGANPLSVTAETVYSASSDGRAFQFDLGTAGALQPLSPVAVSIGSQGSRAIAVDSRSARAYVANAGAGPSLSSCTIASDGRLALATTTGTGSGRSVHVDASGRYAYEVLSGSPGAIQPYLIDALTGALTPLTLAPVGDDPRALALHPGGRFIYVPCAASDQIDALEVDWATGELVALPSTLTGPAPTQLAITESGEHLLCLESTTSTVVVYRVDSSYGELFPLSSGFNDLGNGVSAIGVEPTGRYVFASNVNGSLLAAYSLDASDGSLFATGFQLNAAAASSLRVDPTGRHLYATIAGNKVAHYRFDPSTGLAFGDSVTAGVSPDGLDLRILVR